VNYFAFPAIAAAAYWVLAIAGAIRRVTAPQPGRSVPTPPVSILKPVFGRDPDFYPAIRSHALQDYPEYEILFGARDAQDAAIVDVRRLMAEFPDRNIRLIVTSTRAPNGKAGVLVELSRHARHGVLLVNDSDIEVQPDYLRQVTAPLADSSVGVVTCLYRARSRSLPGSWEAVGIATEFVPSVLVARLLGIADFALGSTMVFRAGDLERAGGFAPLQEYLADDFQLGRRITALGYRVALAAPVVETHLDAQTWREAWSHQVRWSRTIRVSRPSGYYGYIITNATLWAIVAAVGGEWRAGAFALGARMLAAGIVSGIVLHDWQSAAHWWVVPFRDLWGFAVWCAGLFGTRVEWRGQTLSLRRDGTISRIS
jgi:ceramide glucosyltransferase